VSVDSAVMIDVIVMVAGCFFLVAVIVGSFR
jgi:hypothetical protein